MQDLRRELRVGFLLRASYFKLLNHAFVVASSLNLSIQIIPLLYQRLAEGIGGLFFRQLKTVFFVQGSGRQLFLCRPEISGCVTQFVVGCHKLFHQKAAQTHAAVILQEEKETELGGIFRPVHQRQKANHFALIFADPNPVKGGIKLLIKFKYAFCNVRLENQGVGIFFEIHISVQMDDHTQVTGFQLIADFNAFKMHGFRTLPRQDKSTP